MSPEHIRRIKRRKRRRRIFIGVLVFVVLLAALVGWFAVSALKAKNEVEAAVAQASGIQSQVMSGDTAAAKASIEQFSAHIDATYRQTSSPVWALATLIPHYGSDVKAVRQTVDILEDVSNNALPKLASSVDGLNLSQIGIHDGAVDLGSMASVAGNLTAANKVIADANVKFGNVSGTNIPQITDALASAKAKFADLASTVDLGTRVANLMPAMFDLGSGSAPNDGKVRNYLVIAQNNAELRATGGIFGSWGVLTVDGGKLTMGTFSPAQVPPVPGSPVVQLTAEEKSLFTEKMATYQQDPDFTPDFSRAAEIAAAMWKNLNNQTVDGVISIDPVFLQSLLGTTGPVTLADGSQLDGQNTVQALLHDTYVTKLTGAAQDAFFSSAATSIFNHLITSAGGNNAGLVKAVQDSVTNGHVYLWSAHEDEQQQLDGTAISGTLITNPSKPVTGVYFNDGTMGKMDWYLKREVSYEYDQTYPSGAKQYTVHIKLTNTVDPNAVKTIPQDVLGFDEQGANRHGEIDTVTYTYAPAGGRLVDWQFAGSGVGDGNYDSIAVHNDLTVGVKGVTLQPGESFEATIHVVTSPTVAADDEMVLRQTPLLN
ncbi:DUF4012 domain-containing protein [Bifidobacterium avesanii]|uniref:DUF4012 domain-containing protein n=2 Tax=Bifidobacterium avesanii TaxID=1798157 RepID=A0A7K3TI36_9BIFI|nr:DUF4012 domain-containing protein [Bifidobacterium avesanii]